MKKLSLAILILGACLYLTSCDDHLEESDSYVSYHIDADWAPLDDIPEKDKLGLTESSFTLGDIAFDIGICEPMYYNIHITEQDPYIVVYNRQGQQSFAICMFELHFNDSGAVDITQTTYTGGESVWLKPNTSC